MDVHKIHHIFELVFALILIGLGGYRFFFPQKMFPSGDRAKIEKMRWIGLTLALIGVILLALALSEPV
jgi:hypothetical protein